MPDAAIANPDPVAHGAVDLFAVLALHRTFDLDLAELQRQYLAASRQVHPDMGTKAEGAHGTAESQLALAQRAALINQAYSTLRDPAKRANHLLALSGGVSAAEDKSTAAGLLQRVLLWRDEIEEAAGDRHAIDAILTEVRQQHEQALARIADLARQLPGDVAQQAALRQELNGLKYFENLLSEDHVGS